MFVAAYIMYIWPPQIHQLLQFPKHQAYAYIANIRKCQWFPYTSPYIQPMLQDSAYIRFPPFFHSTTETCSINQVFFLITSSSAKCEGVSPGAATVDIPWAPKHFLAVLGVCFAQNDGYVATKGVRITKITIYQKRFCGHGGTMLWSVQ
jgi:hypothetical protein